MPHHLRYQSAEWALHHVVSRCINGFSFLRPTCDRSDLQGVRASARDVLKAHQAHPHGFSQQPLHLLHSEDVHALSQFVQYLKSNFARARAEHDWRGPMCRVASRVKRS